MHTIFFKKNKKSMIMIQEAIILAFAAIILLVMISFGNQLYKATLGESDDGSKANFDSLYSEIKDLIDSPNDKEYRVINYFIGEKKILVEFGTDWNINSAPSTNVDAPHDGRGNFIILRTDDIYFKKLYKSRECSNSACLCLYKDKLPKESDKREEGLMRCRSDGISDKKIIFFNENSNKERTDIVIPQRLFTGTYDGFTLLYNFKAGKGLGVHQIYIEKDFDESTETYNIYMSEINTGDPTDPANIRRKSLGSTQETQATESTYRWTFELGTGNILTDDSNKLVGTASIKVSDSLGLLGTSAVYRFDSPVALTKIQFFSKANPGTALNELQVALHDSFGSRVITSDFDIFNTWNSYEKTQSDFRRVAGPDPFNWNSIVEIKFEGQQSPFTDLWIDGLYLE